MQQKHTILITMGDPAGIGAEVIVKALANKEIYAQCTPVVIGDGIPMSDALLFTNSNLKLRIIEDIAKAGGEPGTIDLLDKKFLTRKSFTYKQVSKEAGSASFKYITEAISLAMAKKADAVVTGPINKEAIHLAGHHFSGHTEIFAHYTNTDSYGMVLIGGSLRVIHVTTHVSLRNTCDIILNNPKRVEQVISLAHEAMVLLGIENPKIGVAGLNPHCSEHGLFGEEEEKSIIPAIKRSREKGLNAIGPLPPDTVFVKAMAGEYDIVVSMYHDQGHIPLKLGGFKYDAKSGRFTSMSGVNATVGLPIIRTSVDHGTAYDRAGDNLSNEGSMVDAINLGIAMAKKRFPK